MKKKIIVYISSILLIISLSLAMLCSCSSANGSADGYLGNAGATKDEAYDSGDGIGSLPSGGVDNPNAKIIKTADATIQTAEYEEFIEELYAKITEYRGYTDADTLRGSAPYRTAYVTVSIPAEHLDAFKEALSGMGTLTYYSAKKLDVSLTYSTLVAKIDTLTLEIGVVSDLFDIAKEDGDLGRISNLEERLSELKLELAEAQAQLAVYDNNIAYSTVNLTVNEKEVIEIVEEEEKGAFARIGENFVKNLKDIGNFFVELFVFLVSALPYIVLIGVIIAAIVFILIYIDRKKKKQNNDKKD